MTLAMLKTDQYCYGDYRHWPEDQRYELIDGQAYAMAPAPSRPHQRLTFELAREIAEALEDSDCEVNIAPFDVRLPDGDEADDEILTVVQPDISVVCDPTRLDDKGCRGAPDWIIEVLSSSTAGQDQIRKLALYERHGVKEYWLVHPIDLVVTVYWLDQGAYTRPTVAELQGPLSSRACPGATINWERVLKGLPVTHPSRQSGIDDGHAGQRPPSC